MGIMAIDIHLGRRPTNDHPRLRRTLMDSKKKKKKKKIPPTNDHTLPLARMSSWKAVRTWI
jgi:hypothetical protein